MKNIIIFIAVIISLLWVSCSSHIPQQHFELFIENYQQDGSWIGYSVTDSALSVRYSSSTNNFADTTVVFQSHIENNDSLQLIYNLDIHSFSCKEQHSLEVRKVTFHNDSGHVQVDPNVNHPQELDYAVRIINSVVPEKYKLEFIDMQPAIEPDGQMRL